MANRYDNGRGTATSLLQHYFRLVALESGIKWSSDNDSEVAQIVDALLQAARQESVDAIVKAMREADTATQEDGAQFDEINEVIGSMAATVTRPQAQRPVYDPAALSAMFPEEEEEETEDYACADCGAIGTFPGNAPHDACAKCGSSNVITAPLYHLTGMWRHMPHTPEVGDSLTDCPACGCEVGVLFWLDGRHIVHECPACGAGLQTAYDTLRGELHVDRVAVTQQED